MAVSELSLDAIHEYILGKGGKVANRELVHHFKKYLINADKNEARIRFKEYVNKIACSKTENGEKFIILRTKYASALVSPASTPVTSPLNTVGIPSNLQDVSPVPSPSKARHPPPYRPPPPVSSPSPSIDNISLCSSSMSIKDTDEPPQAPPRRKSQSSRTLSVEVDETPLQQQEQQQQQQSEAIAVPQAVENSEQAISVKERTQKFNRLASVENDLSPQPPQTQKERRRQLETGADEDDGASVTSLDNKRTEWVVAAARGDYQALAKLATANPRLVKTKEPFSAYTALHWAAKHGNSDIIKLIAGTYSADVNARTNGGYTALHIAMQFGRKEISELLIDVYHAQRDIRDWSGRTAEYYSTTRRNTSKSDNYHKMKIMKKSSEKDLGFLRIGSLNVRVKKTTEAFSNFLGVGGSSGSITPIDHVLEKVHKSWGSADNVSKDTEMAAPKLMPHNKRKLKYTQEQTTSYSTPGTPNQKRALPTHQHNPDSDSDTACGFDSNWKQ